MCYQCEKGFYITDNGRACANETYEVVKEEFSSYIRISILSLFTLLFAL